MSKKMTRQDERLRDALIWKRMPALVREVMEILTNGRSLRAKRELIGAAIHFAARDVACAMVAANRML